MLKNKVLSQLYENAGKIVSGGEMAELFSVSRNSVWKAVSNLQEEGFSIESLKNSGYRFIGDNDVLSSEIIAAHLEAEKLGNRVEILKTVDSTNLYLKRKNLIQEDEGLVVVANEQKGGKGRMGRTFSSAAGEGVYMSVLLKPRIEIEKAQLLTIAAVIAVRRALKTVCGFDAQIKWVNDLYYSGKKLCGILTETSVSTEIREAEYVVLGIGVNTGEIPEAICEIATSTYQITGKRTFRNLLAAEIVNQLDKLYRNFSDDNAKAAILEEYRQYLFIIGKQIKVNNFTEIYDATALGIDDSGALLIRDASGDTKRLNSGEVSLILN